MYDLEPIQPSPRLIPVHYSQIAKYVQIRRTTQSVTHTF